MADKSAFTPEEWNTLREAPHRVALAIATSGASGLLGTMKEAFSSCAAIVEAAKSESPLLRAITSREEVAQAQQALRELARDAQGGDFERLKDVVSASALEGLRTALDILQRKGSPGDYDAYVGFVKSLGKRVAESAREGGFLGFGGERVSEGERRMLAALDRALSPSRA